MKIFKVEYFNSGDGTKSIVLAPNMSEAIEAVVDGVDVRKDCVFKCEEVRDKGVVLTEYSS